MNSECQRCDLCIISPVYCSYFQSSTLCNSPTLSSFPTPFISSFHRLCRSANPLILLLLSFPLFPLLFYHPLLFSPTPPIFPLLPFPHYFHFPSSLHLCHSPTLSSFSHLCHSTISFISPLLSCPLPPPHLCHSPTLSSFSHLCHSTISFISPLLSCPLPPPPPHLCRSPTLSSFSHLCHSTISFISPLLSCPPPPPTFVILPVFLLTLTCVIPPILSFSCFSHFPSSLIGVVPHSFFFVALLSFLHFSYFLTRFISLLHSFLLLPSTPFTPPSCPVFNLILIFKRILSFCVFIISF